MKDIARPALVPTCTLLVAALTIAPSVANAAPGARRDRFRISHDDDVMHVEPAPHDCAGRTTAYRYFDDVKDPGVIFRKRALPKGSFIGMHVLAHDEVYYVVSGQAELTVDDAKRTLRAGTAVFMREGAGVAIHQAGDADLVIIAAYPPAQR